MTAFINTWFMGDLHLGHSNIIAFVNDKGDRIRPFNDIDEHDEILIKNFNDLVMPTDRVYFLGDLVIGRKHLPKLSRFNGRKKLVKGNHDIFKLEDYLPYFEDIISYRIYPQHGFIFSHIPVHESQLERRFKINFHGHLHDNTVTQHGSKVPDARYVNLCPEKTGFKPVSLEQCIDVAKARGLYG